MFRFSLYQGASLSVLAALLASTPSAAQQAEQLPDVEVAAQAGRNSSLPENIPAVVEGVNAKQIATEVNAMTAGETLRYIPSIDVRQRSIGDRNGIVATRTTGTVSSAQSIVYADQLLLSNFLGNSYLYPPRWGLISTQEIDRVDVMYGPFSALYPGNSMGGVVTVTTRMPEKLEIYATLRGSLQNYKEYGTKDTYNTFNGNFAIGNRVNDLSFWVSYDRLNSYGQPLNYSNITTRSTTSTSAVTSFTGGYTDTDQLGNPRFVFGANSIDHSITDVGKVKVAYDITPAIRASYVLGVWGLNSDVGVQSFLKDASGNTLWPTSSTITTLNGTKYKLAAINPSKAEATHLMQGASLKSDTRDVFDFDASVSSYNFQRDRSRAPTTYNGTDTVAGKDTQQDGSGWWTADLRGIWRPKANLLGFHEVTVGTHYDQYKLNQYAYSLTSWASGPDGAYDSRSIGKTETKAVYVQDVWAFHPKWKATFGYRSEWWDAFDGVNGSSGAQGNPYNSRQAFGSSPKASLSYEVTDDLLVRLSTGHSIRFPTVNELFQSSAQANGTIVNDPNLKPEKTNSYDLTGEYKFSKGVFRLSGFLENRTDGIFSYADTATSTTYNRNVDKIQIYGTEAAVDLRDILVEGLSLRSSVTLATSEILQNSSNTSYEGKEVPRIPKWRMKAITTYAPTDKWSLSAGVRYSSASFSQLDNSDWNHNVFGGISSYLVADLRASYKIDKNWTFAAGVNNIGNYKYYVSPHPYPQRTFLAELNYRY